MLHHLPLILAYFPLFDALRHAAEAVQHWLDSGQAAHASCLHWAIRGC